MRNRAPVARFEKINNFSITPPGDVTKPIDTGKADVAFKFVFAGNLGRFQQLGQLVEGAGNCLGDTSPPIELHLVGTGTLETKLRSIVDQKGYSNVFFHSYRRPEEIGPFLQTFDAGVVSLRPGLLDVAFPSKTFSYWANDLPIFAIVDADRELGRMIDETDSGLVCPDNDVASIASHMRKLAQTEKKWTGVEDRTRHLWSPEDTVIQWRNLIARLASDEKSGKQQVS
ncbi:MAG: glycosyltransferase [Pseudomonadota bacterium]